MSQSNAPTALAFTDNRSIDAMIYHFSLRIQPACSDRARLPLGGAGSDLGNGALQIARSNQLVQQNHRAMAWGKRFWFCLWRDANRSRIPPLLNAFSSFAAARLAISY